MFVINSEAIAESGVVLHSADSVIGNAAGRRVGGVEHLFPAYSQVIALDPKCKSPALWMGAE